MVSYDIPGEKLATDYCHCGHMRGVIPAKHCLPRIGVTCRCTVFVQTRSIMMVPA